MIDFKRIQFLLLCFFITLSVANAQHDPAHSPSDHIETNTLQKQFKAWTIHELDVNAIFAQASHTDNPKITLNLGLNKFTAIYGRSNLFSRDYFVTTDIQEPHTRAIPIYSYYTNGEARITVNKDFLYGYFTKGDATWYIEPLHYYVPNTAKNLFVVYETQDVIQGSGTCGVTETFDASSSNKVIATPEADCYRVDIAIASDFAMFQKYGNVADVENHNIGVINNVQGNYTGSFAVDYIINIVTQFIVSTNNDPWTVSTVAGNFLDSFQEWGENNNGFGTQDYDVAELWTDRDFDGTTVGLAWVGVVCSDLRYHVLQDFTGNAQHLRVMTAHEMGHNFKMNHDGENSTHIMAPFVSSSTTWSNASNNSINNFTAGLLGGCLPLVSCNAAAVPIAAFTSNVQNICEGEIISYQDQSLNSPDTWAWHFFGGTPEFSNVQNPPDITYDTPGTYTTELTVSNTDGSNTETKTNYITVSPLPTASFTPSVSGLNVDFVNQSSNADFYIWNFGDPASGSQNTSSATNPSHTYPQDGTYSITLTATNACGSHIYTYNLNMNTPATADFVGTPTTVCTGQSVQFTNLSSPNAVQFNWTLPGGTPGSSVLENPVIVYNNTGFYNVKLKAASPGGADEEFKANYIHVVPSPTPDFTFVNSSGLTVDFTNTTSPLSGNTYQWHFGDSNNSSQINPSHTYASGGSFDVTLDVINSDCGTISITKTVNLVSLPVSSFTANTTSGCTPSQITFTSTSTNATSLSWSFPGGSPNTSTDPSPTITYNTAGTFDVTLIATNAAGSNPHTEASYINITETPVPGFTFNSNGLIVDFTNTTSPLSGNTYSWNFGDASSPSTNINPSHTFSSAGSYTVTLSVTNSCGTFTTDQNLELAILPVSNFTSTHLGCAPDAVSFFDISQNDPTQWNWSFPGGSPSSSIIKNPNVTYSAPGSYTVTLEVTNAAGSNTKTSTNFIVVEQAPIASFMGITTGNSITFTNIANANATSYSWDFGDNSTLSTEENPTHVYTTDGTYIVELTVINDCGTSVTTQTFTISGNTPTASITATSTTICEGNTINYTAVVSPNTQSVNWTFEGGSPSTSSDLNPTITYATPGTYAVTLEAINGSNSASANTTILVEANSVANFAIGVNGLVASMTNASTNADSYAWDFGDMTTSTEFEPSHTYVADGTYTVCLTTTNGCNTDSHCETITISGNGPSANIVADVTTGCAGFSINYHADIVNSSNITWIFPGGTPSTSTSTDVTVLYATAGTYTTTLSATNPSGNASSNLQILVNPMPISIFSSITNGLEVSFTNNSTEALSYSWDFGDNSANAIDENPTHIYTSPGTYTVCLTVTNDCGSETKCHMVTVSEFLPTAEIEIVTSSGDCAPKTVTFHANITNSTSIAWTFENGIPATSSDLNPTVIFNTAGLHQVNLSATNTSGSTNANSISINVTAKPTAAFTSATNGAVVTFSNASTNADSYIWDFGDNTPISTNVDPMHTYLPGSYEACVIAINNCGNDTICQIISIIENTPTAEIEITSTSGDCAPKTVTFHATITNSTDINWTFENGMPATSSDLNPVVIFNTAGDHQVTLSATNTAGTANANNVTVHVLNKPAAAFTSTMNGPVVTFANTSTDADAYAWDFGDNVTGSDTNPTHTYSPGTYEACLIAINTCGNDTTCQTITIVGNTPTAEIEITSTSGDCAPKTVTFHANITNSTDINWTFENGIPATSTDLNPVVIFNTTGDHQVTLSATNAAGTANANTVTINVLDKPTAAFTSNTNGAVVSFANASIDADSYVWDFGDNTTSSDANPTHTYSSGTYEACLVAINSCGNDTTCQTITIDENTPTAEIEITATSGDCAPKSVTFHANITNSTDINWTFENGTPATSTDLNPVVIFNTAGDHQVTLSATNAAGTANANSVTVNVLVKPTATFSSAKNGASIVIFENISTNADSYVWDFGDNTSTSTETNPVHTYLPGTYEACLIALNACGNDTTCQTITIIGGGDAPSANPSVDIDNGCGPLAVTFSANIESADSFSWSFPTGEPLTSLEENPSVTFTLPGIHVGSLTITNATGSVVIPVEVTVTPQTYSSFGFTIDDANNSVIFTNNSLNATSYSWDFGDASDISTVENPTHIYPNGTFTTVLIIEGICNNDTSEHVFQFDDGPMPTAGILNSIASGCTPLVVTFTSTSSANTEELLWTFPGGSPSTSTDNNVEVTYETAGSFMASLTAKNQEGENAATKEITVKPAAIAKYKFSIDDLKLTITENTSKNATSYLWDFGDNMTSDEEMPTHTFDAPGTYKIALTATNECSDSTYFKYLLIVSGIEDPLGEVNIQLSPNPSSGLFYLDIDAVKSGALSMRVFDILGREILTKDWGLTQKITDEIDLTNQPAGNYIFQVQYQGRLLTGKFIKL